MKLIKIIILAGFLLLTLGKTAPTAQAQTWQCSAAGVCVECPIGVAGCPYPTEAQCAVACTTPASPPSSPPGGNPGNPPAVNNVLPICANGTGVNTAIGCIPFDDTTALTAFFLRWGFGVGGGIALLMILYAGFQIITSAGDPKRLQTGQELITSAVAGLILMVFSIFLLRMVGVNILGLF